MVQDFGEKRKQDMKEKTKINDRYTDGPELKGYIVPDFLPRPDQLVFRPTGMKVTLTLDPNTVNFFKTQAKQLNAPYQRMIRNLLDEYVSRMEKSK